MMPRPRIVAAARYIWVTNIDKFREGPMTNSRNSPVGQTATEAARQRAARSAEYRAAREEYQRIDELREVSPLAAHLRERRYELGLTQQEVATAAGTSHSAIS